MVWPCEPYDTDILNLCSEIDCINAGNCTVDDTDPHKTERFQTYKKLCDSCTTPPVEYASKIKKDKCEKLFYYLRSFSKIDQVEIEVESESETNIESESE